MRRKRNAGAEAAATRSLTLLSRCDEAILRFDDETKLMQEICRIAVENGGYRMAWVGVPLSDSGKTIRPAASSGFTRGYLRRLRASWGDNDRGRGPTGTAIRLGQIQVAEDFLTDRRLEPWRREALSRGYRSSAALPLKHGGETLGALSIYSRRPRDFAGPTQDALAKLAGNLAFGIAAIRTRRELRLSRDRLRSLVAELTLAEQRERRRIAGVLHDQLQQLLVGAKLSAQRLEGSTDRKARRAGARLLSILSQAIAESRSLAQELSPPALTRRDLSSALQWLADGMRKSYGLSVEVKADEDAVPATEEATILLYHSARELLFNAVKHAAATTARVESRRVGRLLRLTVSDDGSGFEPAALERARGSGFGLASIKERINLLGGRLEIRSAPGRGSRFTVWAPAAPAAGRHRASGAGRSRAHA